MLKKLTNFFIILVFAINSNLAFAYYNDDDRYRDYNDYNRQQEMNSYQNRNFNDYNSFKSYQNVSYNDFKNLQPSEQGNFQVNAREDFYNSPANRELVNVWNRDSASHSWQVAPNITPADYCGYIITDQTKTESFSNLSGKYEPTSFANVQTNANNQLTSFNMATTKNDWQVQNQFQNIAYNQQNQPTSMMSKTKDIAGNDFTQKIFDIKYSQSQDQNRFSNLLNDCEYKKEQSDYHNFDTIYDTLKDQPQPAKELPTSFKIETTNPLGNKQNFEFENVSWKQDKITGFNAKFKDDNGLETKMSVKQIKQDNGDTMGFNVKIENANGTKELNWSKDDKASLETMVQQHIKGVNPIQIMGAEKPQIGETKISVLSVKYNEKGVLDNVKTKTDAKPLNYGITPKNSERNDTKKDIFRLDQISPSTTKNELHNKNVADMKTKDLKAEKDLIANRIQIKAESLNLTSSSPIKTTWGDTLFLDSRAKFNISNDNQGRPVLTSSSDFLTQTGAKVENIQFAFLQTKTTVSEDGKTIISQKVKNLDGKEVDAPVVSKVLNQETYKTEIKIFDPAKDATQSSGNTIEYTKQELVAVAAKITNTDNKIAEKKTDYAQPAIDYNRREGFIDKAVGAVKDFFSKIGDFFVGIFSGKEKNKDTQTENIKVSQNLSQSDTNQTKIDNSITAETQQDKTKQTVNNTETTLIQKVEKKYEQVKSLFTSEKSKITETVKSVQTAETTKDFIDPEDFSQGKNQKLSKEIATVLGQLKKAEFDGSGMSKTEKKVAEQRFNIVKKWLDNSKMSDQEKSNLIISKSCLAISYYLYGKAIGKEKGSFADFYKREVSRGNIGLEIKDKKAVGGPYYVYGNTELRQNYNLQKADIKNRDGNIQQKLNDSGARIAISWQNINRNNKGGPSHFFIIVKGDDNVWKNWDHTNHLNKQIDTTDTSVDWNRVWRLIYNRN